MSAEHLKENGLIKPEPVIPDLVVDGILVFCAVILGPSLSLHQGEPCAGVVVAGLSAFAVTARVLKKNSS
ncbi:MAG: hypothetical protein ACOX50_02610 [Patescibacteria group bacterium]|jgi:hypothetical protein